MRASSSDSTVRLRLTFLSLSNRKMWYPRMSPLATLLVSGSQASVTLVADVAAGVMFCGLPSGAITKFKTKGYVQLTVSTIQSVTAGIIPALNVFPV